MILLLGDGFIDRYHIGKVRGLSAEAPIPIVDITSVAEFSGGVINVWENLKSLGIESLLPLVPHKPVKNRLVTPEGLQLARWDEEDYCSPIDLFDITSFSSVVVSDYGKGAVTSDMIDFLVRSGKPLFVDTKRNPLDWIEARDITFFPNLSEYKKYEKEFAWFPQVVLKLSELGIAWVNYGTVTMTRPAVARKVVCVNGAGDTVLAAWVAATSKGATIPQSLEFANLAAAVVVEKPFTASATLEEIQARL